MEPSVSIVRPPPHPTPSIAKPGSISTRFRPQHGSSSWLAFVLRANMRPGPRDGLRNCATYTMSAPPATTFRTRLRPRQEREGRSREISRCDSRTVLPKRHFGKLAARVVEQTVGAMLEVAIE